MNEEEIQLSTEEWDEFYESQGSKYFKLESEILAAHGEDQKTLLYKILNSTTQLIQVIGVVAGFGFTGLGYVKSDVLFFTGESLLFVSIFIGLFWTQKIYKSNFKGTNAEVERVKKIFKNRFEVFKKVYDKALSATEKGEAIKIPQPLLGQLMKKNNELLENYQDKEVKKKEWEPLSLLMFLFAIGGISLLLSFLLFCP
ncbi:MAG: hypothetical protein HY433_03155 [Candidatus Liptonbacteria bacterium]|nr:hypothetical protein [Candidatus Liptonbacteria bacterium]